MNIPDVENHMTLGDYYTDADLCTLHGQVSPCEYCADFEDDRMRAVERDIADETNAELLRIASVL